MKHAAVPRERSGESAPTAPTARTESGTATDSAVEIAAQVAFVDGLVARIGGRSEHVVPLLQGIQERFGYLPEPALRALCARTGIAPADLVGVATFYRRFRQRRAGRFVLRVCHGTACHLKQADRITEALRRELGLGSSPEEDTDGTGRFTLEAVNCVGCCALAPVVEAAGTIYGHVEVEGVPALLTEIAARDVGTGGDGKPAAEPADPAAHRPGKDAPGAPPAAELRVALDSCCIARGADRVWEALSAAVRATGAGVRLKAVGCLGCACASPQVEVALPGEHPVRYGGVRPEQAEAIVARHFPMRSPARRAGSALRRLAGALFGNDAPALAPSPALDATLVPAPVEHERRIATEHAGVLAPLDLDEYRQSGGFHAWELARGESDPGRLIALVRASGLRGRGGGGFPAGEKWAQVRQAAGAPKYVIVNGDEGDPGAFMDRMLLESYPYRVIEGAAIAARAVGATEGIVYVRAEYPLAVSRVEEAIRRCTAAGLLAEAPAAAGGAPATPADAATPFSLRVVRGAGAYVCGEETALLAALEGRRGTPRFRPPYPAEQGLWGRPTLINNVETLAVVPWIVRHGAAAFAALGAGHSRGTKVFALAGRVRRAGLLEVPLGVTVRTIVEEIGGGVEAGRRFKAVQIGGPSGGCLPAALADTPVEYEALRAAGTILGSGGLIVLDDRDCMVELARYFVAFSDEECCGRCSLGRIGGRRLLELLERICAGRGRAGDLDDLERIGRGMQAGSLCGLGRSAPNVVLSTLRYFREEYLEHLAGRCPAGSCRALIAYRIEEGCIGCTLCAQHCPAGAIPVTPYRIHRIDQAACTRCDACRRVCPADAVKVR